jgi:hypothetical protein
LRLFMCPFPRRAAWQVGPERELQEALAGSLEEAATLGIYTQLQALDYMGKKAKAKRLIGKSTVSAVEEGRNALAAMVLNHVPGEMGEGGGGTGGQGGGGACGVSRVVSVPSLRRVARGVGRIAAAGRAWCWSHRCGELSVVLVALLRRVARGVGRIAAAS